MKILTSWKTYIDIDWFACLYAYNELLDLLWIENEVVFTWTINASVTEKYSSLKFYKKNFSQKTNSTFVIMDLSNPANFEEFVEVDKIDNIFDHHPWFEEFWQEKIWDKAVIKPIWAAATLIYEEFKKYNLLDKISKLSAELLAVAILSNTLNFQSYIAKDIDINAYNELKKYFDFYNWFENDYFLEVQEYTENNLEFSLVNDSKIVEIGDKIIFISQCELWDTNKIYNDCISEIKDFLDKQKEEIVFLNLINISNNFNLIIFKDFYSLNYFKKYFPEFTYDDEKLLCKTQNVLLRKEILARFYNQ